MNTTIYRRIKVTDSGDRLAAVEPAPTNETPLWAKDVSQAGNTTWVEPRGDEKPFFVLPIPFVIPPADAGEPFHPHNHCPAITWCPNGDLLAAWFSTVREAGTEMTILAARLRAGRDAWDPAAEFFKGPRRNMTGTALFHDGEGTLFHFNGMGREDVTGWENLVVLLRSSRDNGVSWTPPRVISTDARYQRRNQVIAGTSITPGGLWLQPCDGTPGGEGPILLVSFTDACRKMPREQWKGMTFEDGNGKTFTGYGMFAALSFDEGETWPVQKLLTPGSGTVNGWGHTGEFTFAFDNAEPEGYLAATQTPDGVIHLVSSRLYYRFNLTWLKDK